MNENGLPRIDDVCECGCHRYCHTVRVGEEFTGCCVCVGCNEFRPATVSREATAPAPAGEDVPTEPGIWWSKDGTAWIAYRDKFKPNWILTRAIGTEHGGENGPINSAMFQLPRGGWFRAVPASELAALKADNERLKAELAEAIKWGETRNAVADAMTDYVPDCARELAMKEELAAIRNAIMMPDDYKGTVVEYIAAEVFQPSDKEDEIAALRQQVAELTRERDEARKAILSFGSNPAGFDWAVLGRIDELETQLTAAREDIREVRGSGIAYTNEGRYHEVQIGVELWERLSNLTKTTESNVGES